MFVFICLCFHDSLPFNVNIQKLSVSLAIRDWEGRVLVTMRMNSPLYLYPDPLLADTYAALHATKSGSDLGFWNIILEGDALQVVNAIKNAHEQLNSIGMLVTDVKNLLRKYESETVNHARRDANVVAHTLGWSALSVSNVVIELEDIPHSIVSLL